MIKKLLKFLKMLLITQILSIIYSVLTITFLELIIRGLFQYTFGLVLVQVIGIGILSFLVSRRYLDIKLLNIIFINLPYGIYCVVILAFYGWIFPISGIEDDYGIGLILMFGLIGCWISITIGALIGNELNRRAIHSE